MALVLADRVKESTTTTGTGTVTLLGASPGFQSFAVIGNTNTTYYTIAGQNTSEWEVGIGTYTASGTTLARTTVLSNSAGTQPSALSFSAGTKDVFVTYPAEKSINEDASGNVGIGTTAPTARLDVAGNVIISTTDNTNAALQITQLGTGNALLVEDSTNPDSTPLVVASNGQLVVGHTAAIGAAQNTNIQSQSTSGFAGVSAFRWSADTIPPRFQVGKSRGAAVGTNAIVQSGDQLGGLYFYGDDGTDLVSQGASIIAEVDGTPGVDDMPGRLVFSTTADGASSPTERMRIDSAGNVGIGATAPVTKLEVAGSNNSTWSATATTISGTTMAIGGTVTGTIAIGDLVHGAAVQPYTRITAGSALSWTVSVSQTVASATLVGGATYSSTLIRITDTDVGVPAGQPTGGLQFYTSDVSSPTAGVGAYVAAVAESSTPDTALVFGTRDNSGGGVDANESARIDSTGRLIVGYSASIGLANTTNIQSYSTGAQSGVTAVRWSADALAPRLQVGKSRSATIGTNTIVQSGDALGGLYFYGDDGTDLVSDAASIIASVDGTPGTNDMPGRLTFNTTADGAATPTERMRIDSSGNVGVGNAAPTTKLDVTGIVKATNVNMGFTSTATAAGTTTLTVSSTHYQRFTGTTTQTIVLPVTSTLATGVTYEIENASTGNLTVNSSGGNLVVTVIPGVTVQCMCIGTTLTTAADWDPEYNEFASITGTGAVVLATSPQISSLGVGTAASGTAGEIRATNNITAYYSDDRFKTNLGNIPDALAKVQTLNGFYYEANELAQSYGYEKKLEVGVSAQQVQAVQPEVVAPAPIDENYLTVRYERLVPLLIEAIKELNAKVTALEQVVAKSTQG